MAVLLETPVPALVAGMIVEAMLVAWLMHSRRQVLWIPIVLVLLATLGLVLLEAAVVTDREEVAAVLDAIASALESNDLSTLLAYVSTTHGAGIRRDIQARLPPWRVTDAHVGRDLKVEINPLTVEPTAAATFTGRVTVTSRDGTLRNAHYLRKFTVKLRREGSGWLAYDYEERPVIGPGSQFGDSP